LKEELIDMTTRIARGLNIKGLLNIQFVIHKSKAYVLEVNQNGVVCLTSLDTARALLRVLDTITFGAESMPRFEAVKEAYVHG